jgi:tetratricopeptide (TPR) repeat protein
MKIPFNSPARKRLIVALALAFAAVYLGLVTLTFMASIAGARTGLTWLKTAVWLDPGNADYRNHLGRYYDIMARDPVAAISHYKKTVELNPHSARFWFDLASSYQVLGDVTNQSIALEHAIQADSMTPDVAWEAANLYLVQGEDEKALREFRVVMANDPSLAPSAIALCWRIRPDVDLLLRDAVPPTADAYLALLALLQNDVISQFRKAVSPTDDLDITSLAVQVKDETVGSFKVWNALIQSHQPFEKRYAYDYFQFLIGRGEIDQAVLVWKQTADRFALSSYLPSTGNLVVDGTFSLDVLNNGFDWQYQKQAGVNLMLDPSTFHSGRRSFLITFDGPGINDAGLFQFIPVQPDTTYEFSAYYHNGPALEGAGGPRFTVTDFYSQRTDYYQSEELRDANSWKSVEGEFTTGPNCKLVILHVVRLPKGSPIRGKLWIDDFRIVRKPS